jgi:hypothetical protein
MYKGDISNDMPRRVLVNSDILLIKTLETTKKYKFIPVKYEQVQFDRLLLNKFYVYTTHAGVTLELISFDYKIVIGQSKSTAVRWIPPDQSKAGLP